MTKKEQCKELIIKFFGPATGMKVDGMNEDEVVGKCKKMVLGFLGPEKAKAFDKI